MRNQVWCMSSPSAGNELICRFLPAPDVTRSSWNGYGFPVSIGTVLTNRRMRHILCKQTLSYRWQHSSRVWNHILCKQSLPYRCGILAVYELISSASDPRLSVAGTALNSCVTLENVLWSYHYLSDCLHAADHYIIILIIIIHHHSHYSSSFSHSYAVPLSFSVQSYCTNFTSFTFTISWLKPFLFIILFFSLCISLLYSGYSVLCVTLFCSDFSV